MSRSPYDVAWSEGVDVDLRNLGGVDGELVSIARQMALDMAAHHLHGKELGDRNVSGDLSGFCRLCFDLPGHRPLRFRLLYDRPSPGLIRIAAVGERAGASVRKRLAEPFGLPDASGRSLT